MATKTISIDFEAYRRLRRLRRDNESFSDVLKRVLPKPFDAQAWFKRLSNTELSDKAVRAIRQQIRNRRRPTARSR